MRALVLALLVVVPSLAADETSLQKAVRLFHSKDAAAREQGSRTADASLRKLLAPLLQALEDKDPEVRRRARRAILGLVPGELEKEQQPAQAPQQLAIRLALLGQLRQAQAQRVRLQFAPVLRLADVQDKHQFGPVRVRLADVPALLRAQRRAEEAKSRELIHQFGLTTREFNGTIARKSAHGFQVLKVAQHSRAARLGLVKNDIVVRVDRTDVKTLKEFAAALGPQKGWDRLRLRVLRRGEWLNLPIVR